MARSLIVDFLTVCSTVAAVLVATTATAATFNPIAYPAMPDDALFSTVYYDRTATNPAGYKAINYGFAAANTDSVPLAKVATTTALKDGWHGLYVKVDASAVTAAANDAKLFNATYYAVGYAEGFATSELIYYSWYNQMVGETLGNMSSHALEWIDTHIAYMRRQVAAKGFTDPYWGNVAKVLLQIEGMTDGYNAAQNKTLAPKNLDFLNIFLISFVDETADVERSAYILQGLQVPEEVERRLKRVGEHCSALVKLVPNDIFIAHTTWNSLSGLLRTYKTYQYGSFVLQTSSYPGNVASDDDYYVINNGLVAQETTNHNHNSSNTAGTQPYSVSEFIRVIVAAMASNGDPKVWGDTFCQDNSGTYNNQYMILQMQGFNQGTGKLAANSFYVAEQMPGLCINRDQTDHLNTAGYWASYNRPFYPETFEGMNWTNMEKLSPYYSYANNYRALIFQRNQSMVNNLNDMKRLMRYNDYKNDPLSVVPNCPDCWPQHTPYLSIAARCDLVPANGTFGVLNGEISLQDEAAIDAKITSLVLMKHNKMMSTIASGPPYGGASDLPAFAFSKTLVTPRPRNLGLPDVIQYDYTDSNSLYINAPAAIPDFSKVRGGVPPTFTGLFDANTFNRLTFGQVLHDYLVDELGYPEDVTVTMVSAYWYDVSILVSWTVTGAQAPMFQNMLAREGDANLAGIGLSRVGFSFTGVPGKGVEDNEASNLWIIGVVVASLMGALIIGLLVNYIRNYKDVTKEDEAPFSSA